MIQTKEQLRQCLAADRECYRDGRRGWRWMLDLLLVAVKPEYQNKGVNALLFSDLIPVYQQLGFEYAESNPELELNGKVQAQWEYFRTEQHKRRRAFIKEIK